MSEGTFTSTLMLTFWDAGTSPHMAATEGAVGSEGMLN